MCKFLSTLLLFLAATAHAVTVDGFCYLEGQQNHAGTKVKFIRVSPSAVTDSTYTDGSGYFTKNVAAGVYNVEYSHGAEIEIWTDPNHTLISNQTLSPKWLLPSPVSFITGTLSGTLGPGGFRMPFYVNVNPSDTLRILPGTMIQCAFGYYIQVDGVLIADGQLDDRIVLTGHYPGSSQGWGGIWFRNQAYPSLLRYCLLSEGRASGLNRTNGNNGGVIFCDGSSPVLENCVLANNRAEFNGGALACFGGRAVLKQCTFARNQSGISAGGSMYIVSSTAQISSCMFYGSTGYHIQFLGSQNCVVQYSDFSGASLGNFYFPNDGPLIIGVKITTNANGDSADTWYNIFEDPMFTDTSAGDYSLRLGSPCIDAGDPELQRDPDSTIADIGAFFFPQDLIVWPRALEFGSVAVGVTDSLALSLYNRANTPLTIHSITSSDAHFTPQFAPADSVLAAGDTLEIWVRFAPSDSGFFSGSLTVLSNSLSNDTIAVALSGEGGLIPAPVDDVVLQIQNGDATICWSTVDSTIYGSPLTVDAYLVYFSENASGPFWFHGLTTDTCYTHSNVVQFANAMFYEVSAFVGSINGLNQIVEEHDGRITREELMQEYQTGLWKYPVEWRGVLKKGKRHKSIKA